MNTVNSLDQVDQTLREQGGTSRSSTQATKWALLGSYAHTGLQLQGPPSPLLIWRFAEELFGLCWNLSDVMAQLQDIVQNLDNNVY